MRTRYKVYDQGTANVYFVTSTVVQWIPIFVHKDHFEIIINALRFCRDHQGLRLYAYVIMDNHLHLIVSAPDLSKTMQSIKSYTSKMLIDSITRKNMLWLLNQLEYYKAPHKKESIHQVWQEGYHPQEIQSGEMLRQKIEYIHANPVRRGYVDRPEHWVYSSARHMGNPGEGLIDLDSLPW